VLNNVDYQVYVEPVGSQNMNLSWNSQVSGGWSLVNYKVYYRLNNEGTWNLHYTTDTNTVSTFDASSVGCGNAVYFYVEANLVNNGVNYKATSNSVNINMFRYASAPQSVNVQWASIDIDNTYIDIRMNFSNPSTNGCGVVEKIVVNVEDSSGNIIATKDNIAYVSGTTPYEINFNNVIPYTPNGNVVVYMVTSDTNSSGYLSGAQGIAPYISDDLPIYKNISMNVGRTLLTFDVITQLNLTPKAVAATFVMTPTKLITQYPWRTNVSTTNIDISKTTLSNNETKYSVTMYPGLIGATSFPEAFGIVVSNNVGNKVADVSGDGTTPIYITLI
jgi:hypothetical protein